MILTGRDLQWYIEVGRLKIDPVEKEQFQQNGVDLILEGIERQGPFFYLGCTKETLAVPDDLMAFVELRSTWARKGFFLPPTIVDAGFQGNLTLEILVFGNTEIKEIVGSRFAHLIFAKTTGPCVQYSGKYLNQNGITHAIADPERRDGVQLETKKMNASRSTSSNSR